MQEPQPGESKGYINARGETIVVANLGGRATKVLDARIGDVGVGVENEAGEWYWRTIRDDAFLPWHKVGE